MFLSEIVNGVKLITETCFEAGRGTKVLLVAASDDDFRVASVLAAGFKGVGAEAAVVVVDPPREVEPPAFLTEAMKKVDIAISLGDLDYGHTLARKEISALGIQYAYIPAVMQRIMMNTDLQGKDLIEIRDRTEDLAGALTAAKEVRVSSPSGTDLVLSVEGRRGIPVHPVFRRPGHIAIIPFYSEVACAPLEGSARGTFVVDGNIWGHAEMERLVSEPITWKVDGGKVVDIRGGKDASLLKAFLERQGENAFSIGELGIGTNFKLSGALTGTKLDDAIFGTVHLALGRNVDLGGTLMSRIHIDFLSTGIRLDLDGRTFIEEGRYLR